MNTPWETPPFPEDMRDDDERQPARVKQLLLGCGRKRDRRMWLPPDATQGAGPAINREWEDLTTLDINPDVAPDIVCDLNAWPPWRPYTYFATPPVSDKGWEAVEHIENGLGCLRSDFWDEVHAYEVLEHLGAQGDATSFFAQFSEIWRILKPGGHLLAVCPSRFSPWLWGDPSHRRAIIPETLVFLDQEQYQRQCDDEATRTPMSDFRNIYKADFRRVYSHDSKQTHSFILQAVKPSRVRL